MSSKNADEKLIEEIARKVEDKDLLENARLQPPKSLDMRSPDDAKAYLDNLYIEYGFQCNSEKDPGGCHRLANYLENIRGDFKQATALYKKTCDEMGFARSCFTYSKNRMLGRGCKPDLLEACKYSFISCDDHHLAEGCLNSGVCLQNGVGGLPKQVPESLKYFEKACDKENPIACIRLFKVYIEGHRPSGIERQPSKAFDYARRACDMNDMLGCLNASIMCRKGDGVPKDDKLSEEYRTRANDIRDQNSSTKEHSGVVFGEQHK